jgi:D-aminoacyl-tRNA deacylase
MKVALIHSAQDKAGVNIRKHIEVLLDEDTDDIRKTGRTYGFHEVEGRLIYGDGVDAGLHADLVIFLSRHASVNPVPVLTVHVTGNLRDAELGGAAPAPCRPPPRS